MNRPEIYYNEDTHLLLTAYHGGVDQWDGQIHQMAAFLIYDAEIVRKSLKALHIKKYSIKSHFRLIKRLISRGAYQVDISWDNWLAEEKHSFSLSNEIWGTPPKYLANP